MSINAEDAEEYVRSRLGELAETPQAKREMEIFKRVIAWARHAPSDEVKRCIEMGTFVEAANTYFRPQKRKANNL